MRLPIIKALRKREYVELALFQDTVVSALYRIDEMLVLHGGTCVWRCFGGSRFSTDIDAYMRHGSDSKAAMADIQEVASKYGIRVDKAKDTGNLIFIAFSSANAYLKVEINYTKKWQRALPTRFERADGTYLEVLALSAEDLFFEKIAAYSDRRFIRDIYDMYVLSDYINLPAPQKKEALNFLDNVKNPINEKDLEALIYEGPVPSFKAMLGHIRGRLS